MVSNIRYPAFKKFAFKKRVTFTRFVFVVLFVYVVATIPKIAFFALSLVYVMSGPTLWVAALVQKARSRESQEASSRRG